MTETRSYLEMAFDKDGYFASHNRNLFAAAMWLQDLIEAGANWPLAAQQLTSHLSEHGGSLDHNAMQVSRAKELISPWLLNVTEHSTE